MAYEPMSDIYRCNNIIVEAMKAMCEGDEDTAKAVLRASSIEDFTSKVSAHCRTCHECRARVVPTFDPLPDDAREATISAQVKKVLFLVFKGQAINSPFA